MRHLADEFLDFVREAGSKTPMLNRLYPYFDPNTPSIGEGSNDISLDWCEVWITSLAIFSLNGLLVYRRSL